MSEDDPATNRRPGQIRGAITGLGLLSANAALGAFILGSLFISPPATPPQGASTVAPTPFTTVVIGAQPADTPTSAPVVAASPTATTRPRGVSPTATAKPAAPTATPTPTAPAATATPSPTILPGA